MTIAEVQAKARELKELKRMREELDGEIGELETALKDSMGECELLIAGEYKLTYQSVSSSRFDTAAFRKAFPDIANNSQRTRSIAASACSNKTTKGRVHRAPERGNDGKLHGRYHAGRNPARIRTDQRLSARPV